MRILHCTDFHANKAWFDWLVDRSTEYSVICVTGDFLDLLEMHWVETQVRMVKDAVKRIECTLALCSGNHDSFTGEPAPESLHHASWLNGLRREGVWMDGDTFQYGGTQFRCIGWNGPFRSADRREIWLTHAPPAASLVAAGSDESEAGDGILGEICRAEMGPWIALSGHQHNPRSWAEKVGRTWCFNPGVARNSPIPNHIVVDLAASTATYRVNDLDHASVAIAR